MSAAAREAIRVVARFRPLNKVELERGGRVCVDSVTSTDVVISTSDAASHSYSFDRIFATNALQEDVYQYAAKPIVDSLFAGYNGCLLAYGQTGSGKTHTMMGVPDDEEGRGVIPRAVRDIFAQCASAPATLEFTLSVAFVEIYCERIKDLFAPKNDNLAVGEDPSGAVYIKNVTEVYVTSQEEVFELMARGNAARAVAATGMNAGSSRSHSLFTLTLAQKNSETGSSTRAKLYLVDLAGSETVSKTGVSGQQLEELKKINKSLSALGNVINALTDGKSTHVPYRDSKLTRVLEECIGGNARTTLVIACSPSAWNEAETISTLRFGKRAKRIVNRAVANKERSPEEMRRHIVALEACVNVLIASEKAWLAFTDNPSLPAVKAHPDAASLIVNAATAVQQAVKLLDSGGAAPSATDAPSASELGRSDSVATYSLGRLDSVASVSGAALDAPPDDMAVPPGGAAPDGSPSGPTDSPTADDTPAAAHATGPRPPMVTADMLEALSHQAQLLADREQLEQQVVQLTALLGEVKGEMVGMRDALVDRDARIDTMSKLLEARDSSPAARAQRAASVEAGADASGRAAASPTSNAARTPDVGFVQEQLHMARQENEELRNEVADLQTRLSEAEAKHKTFLTRAATASSSQLSAMASAAKVDLAVANGGDADDVITSPVAAPSVLSSIPEEPNLQRAASGGDPSPDSDETADLKVRLDAQEALLIRLTDALTQRNRTIADYEERLSAVMQQMADAVATGDMSRIGQGRAMNAVSGARIMPGGPSAVRSIRGGGGSAPASPATPSTPAALTSVDSFLGRIMRRISGSPATPERSVAGGSAPLVATLSGFVSAVDATAATPAGAAAVAHVPARTPAPPPVPVTPVGVPAADMLAVAVKACEAGDEAQMRAVLRAGFPVNTEDKVGRTPLLHAARNGHIALCQFLVQAGADPRATDKDGRNALHYAARRGHVETVRWLLATGASVTTTDVHALTPLHQATLGKSAKVVKLLLEAGADIAARDANGCNALKLAKRFEKPDDIESVAVVETLTAWSEANAKPGTTAPSSTPASSSTPPAESSSSAKVFEAPVRM